MSEPRASFGQPQVSEDVIRAPVVQDGRVIGQAWMSLVPSTTADGRKGILYEARVFWFTEAALGEDRPLGYDLDNDGVPGEGPQPPPQPGHGWRKP